MFSVDLPYEYGGLAEDEVTMAEVPGSPAVPVRSENPPTDPYKVPQQQSEWENIDQS